MTARRRGRGGSKGGRGRKGDSQKGDSRKGAERGEAELERRILQTLTESARGPLKTKDLARELGIGATEYRAFRRLLTGMERRGTIYRVRGHRYAVSSKLDLVTGRISLTRDGHGFVRPGDAGEDVYVPAQRLGTAMDGDRVVARIERKPRNRSPEGTVLRVLERARESVVGTLHEGRRVSYVVPLDVRLKKDVLIAPGDEGEAEDGQVVVVKLSSYGEGRVGPTGVVERVLGQLSDPGVDVLAVAYGHGLSLEFSPDLQEAAADAAERGSKEPGEERIDRTELIAFTIDPADAKDHDDALSVVDLGEGRVEVGVHIADVAHFVRPRTPVDVEAFARGTSVYLVDRTIPMLPAVLSNDVCSLNAGEPKLAVSVFMQLDPDGRVIERRYERTTILCRAAISYEEAQAVLDGAGSIDVDIDAAIRTLDDRARRVRAQRKERGALELDLPEAKVVLDDQGLPVDIRKRERLESHRLIEDYMILANEVVAGDLEARDLGALYRVHEPPSRERTEALSETLASFGHRLSPRKTLKPGDLQRVLAGVRGKSEEALVNTLVLRSLKKARYDVDNLGHFGLASRGYLHFTSPIRRYPDLVVHRVVTSVLVSGDAEPYLDSGWLQEAADKCSASEQAAEEAERASVALKKVEFMERHLGDTFSGRISGVAPFGFFVALDEVFVEGLVHVSGLHDDFYHFREREHALTGERGGKRFRLGDRVEIQVSRVDKETRQIDFVLRRKL